MNLSSRLGPSTSQAPRPGRPGPVRWALILGLLAAPATVSAQPFCPPIPPAIRAVVLTSVRQTEARAGDWIEVFGQNFDQLPANTWGWFSDQSNAQTALGEFHKTSSGSGVILVPGHHVGPGRALLSLYYEVSYDCSAQGGSSNSIAGNWVNSRSMLNFKILPPDARPVPVSNLTAMAINYNDIQLHWNDDSNNEDEFEILDGPDVRHTTHSLGTVPANRTSEPITGYAPNTTRCFEVRSKNRSGYRAVAEGAKACATTPPKPGESGILDIQPFGPDSAFCGFSRTINLIALRDVNTNGHVDFVGPGALPNPFPAWVALNGDFSPPWEVAVADQYAANSDIIVTGNFGSCPDRPQVVAFHFRRNGSTLTPTFVVAGDLSARTGTNNEQLGWVEIGSEFNGQFATYDAAKNTVTGIVGGLVSFEIYATDRNGAVYSIQANTFITLDFSKGVTVLDDR